jgi:hypothetical protein
VTVTLPTAGTLRSSFAFSHHNGDRWIACSMAAAAGPELIGRLDKEFYWKTDESAVTGKLYAAISSYTLSLVVLPVAGHLVVEVDSAFGTRGTRQNAENLPRPPASARR